MTLIPIPEPLRISTNNDQSVIVLSVEAKQLPAEFRIPGLRHVEQLEAVRQGRRVDDEDRPFFGQSSLSNHAPMFMPGIIT